MNITDYVELTNELLKAFKQDSVGTRKMIIEIKPENLLSINAGLTVITPNIENIKIKDKDIISHPLFYGCYGLVNCEIVSNPTVEEDRITCIKSPEDTARIYPRNS